MSGREVVKKLDALFCKATLTLVKSEFMMQYVTILKSGKKVSVENFFWKSAVNCL